jgi:hypothetical protein
MLLTQIIIQNESAPKDPWETLIPAVLGIVGVFVGAWLTNVGQRRRDLATTAQQIRSLVLTAVSGAAADLRNMDALLSVALADRTPELQAKGREAQAAASASASAAQDAVGILTGVADSEVAKQGALLYSQLIEMHSDLLPLLRSEQTVKAKENFSDHRSKIHRTYNILIFMVQAREQLQTGGWWFGYPFFRSQKQATLHHDHLGG